MILKTLEISNFKGIKHQVIDFTDKTTISGKNASGKTTIATAIMWLLFDKDYELNSNPNIRPIGVEECIPTVDMTMICSGRAITFTKMQKCKVTNLADGTTKVALNNAYEINDVPKTERDFKAYISELGYTDSDIMLACMHPSVFTSKKSADMRKILFGMATELTDEDIANQMMTVPELAEQLSNGFTVDELVAMNKATKKKADEQIASIPEQIVGMENAKVTVDVKKLTEDKKVLTDEFNKYDEALKDVDSKIRTINDLNAQVIEIKFKQTDVINKANAHAYDEKNALNKQIRDLDHKLDSLKTTSFSISNSLMNITTDITHKKANIDACNEKLKALKTRKFDDSSLVCPTCGQEYPSDKKKDLKANFNAENKALTDKWTKTLEEQKEALEKLNDSKAAYDEKGKAINDEMDAINSQISELEAKANDSEVTLVDPQSIPEWVELENEIKEIAKKVDDETELKIQQMNFKERKEELHQSILQIDHEFALLENNKLIDKKIAKLQEDRLVYEQKKADAEKMLYQIDELSKAKNTILSESINKNFSIVSFKLFEYQKNGLVKDCCIPYIGDKELGKSMNTALEIAAKLDICDSLQQFYGYELPILLDNAESINDVNIPDLGRQLVLFKVTEDDLVIGGNDND